MNLSGYSRGPNGRVMRKPDTKNVEKGRVTSVVTRHSWRVKDHFNRGVDRIRLSREEAENSE